jgi:hypothetical protein
MTYEDHKAAAERLLAGTPVSAEDREAGIALSFKTWPPTEMQLREAQVHATLALATITAWAGEQR